MLLFVEEECSEGVVSSLRIGAAEFSKNEFDCGSFGSSQAGHELGNPQ